MDNPEKIAKIIDPSPLTQPKEHPLPTTKCFKKKKRKLLHKRIVPYDCISFLIYVPLCSSFACLPRVVGF